jgi:hypothetical protein
MLARARRLTDIEAHALYAAHAREVEADTEYEHALRTIGHVGHGYARLALLRQAEAEGRASVVVLSGTSRGEAVAGIVGRLAQAFVVADIVPPAIIRPLTEPWTSTIGPLHLPAYHREA